jgi:hypothetical protein
VEKVLAEQNNKELNIWRPGYIIGILGIVKVLLKTSKAKQE